MLGPKKVGAAVAIQVSDDRMGIDDLMRWAPELRAVAERLAQTFDVPDGRVHSLP